MISETCPRCGRTLDSRVPQRCGVCHWRSPGQADSDGRARGDGGHRSANRTDSTSTDPGSVPPASPSDASRSPTSASTAGSGSGAARWRATGDGTHTTSGGPTDPVSATTDSSGLMSGTTVSGRVTEVLPQQIETVDRRAESLARGVAIGCLLAPFRALGFLLMFLFSRPMAMMSLVSGMRARKPLDPLDVPITPFRLQVDDGTTRHCALRGELRGGSISVGDRVTVHGRLSRHTNVLNATTVTHVDSGTIIRPYIPAAARTSKGVTLLYVIAVVLMVYLLLSIVL